MGKTKTAGYSKTHSHLHVHREVVRTLYGWRSLNVVTPVSEHHDHGHWHLHAAGGGKETHEHVHSMPRDFWPHREADVVEVDGEEREHRR